MQASGNETLEYQWKKDGVILHGVTGASLSLTALESVDSGAYVVIVSNEVGRIESDPVIADVVQPVSIVLQLTLMK